MCVAERSGHGVSSGESGEEWPESCCSCDALKAMPCCQWLETYSALEERWLLFIGIATTTLLALRKLG
jgi:hypothetical protein